MNRRGIVRFLCFSVIGVLYQAVFLAAFMSVAQTEFAEVGKPLVVGNDSLFGVAGLDLGSFNQKNDVDNPGAGVARCRLYHCVSPCWRCVVSWIVKRLLRTLP
jgi:hypothetical protein